MIIEKFLFQDIVLFVDPYASIAKNIKSIIRGGFKLCDDACNILTDTPVTVFIT